jgi:hypothetical protein
MLDREQVIFVPPDVREHARGRIGFEEIESPLVRKGFDYWQRLCDGRRFPARADLSPREMGNLLRNVVLMKVLNEGEDYEFRIVGDAHVIAHGFSMQGLHISDVDGFSPGYGSVLKRLYDRVVRKAEPYALRGWLERGETHKKYIYTESAFMPLGHGETVDHVFTVSVYVPRDGLEPV